MGRTMSQSVDRAQLRYVPGMSPRWRKVGLTAHIAASVGWLGAVAAFLALSLVGLRSHAPATVRSAYVAMELLGGFVIIPLALAALVTGLIQSLGTEWGLFRYNWVVAKLVLTLGAVALLVLHQFTEVAEAARRVSATASGQVLTADRLGVRLAATAALAVAVLLVTTVLSVFKPWGRMRRRLDEFPENPRWTAGNGPRLGRNAWLILGAIIVTGFVVLHLSGIIGRHHH